MSGDNCPQIAQAFLMRRMPGWKGDARLYRLSPPFVYTRWDDDYENEIRMTADFVIVTAADPYGMGPETFAFPAHPESPQPLSWIELPGSEQGHLSHERVLRRMGYTTVVEPVEAESWEIPQQRKELNENTP